MHGVKEVGNMFMECAHILTADTTSSVFDDIYYLQ